MDTVTTTFVLANWIVKGLTNGDFERVGGVIREIGTKKVVTWLREYGTNGSQVPTPTGSSANLLNLAVSGSPSNSQFSVRNSQLQSVGA